MIETLKFAWQEFKQKPIIGLLFAAVVSLGFIYIDLKKESNANKASLQEQTKDCKLSLSQVQNEVTLLRHEKRITDSTLSALNAEWKLMQRLGVIKLPN